MKTIKNVLIGLFGFIMAVLMILFIIFKGIVFFGNVFFAMFFGKKQNNDTGGVS